MFDSNPWDARADAPFLVYQTDKAQGLPNAQVFGSSSIGLLDDIPLGFGNTVAAPDAFIEWNTSQTNDALATALSGSMTWILGTKDNIENNRDLGFATNTNPQLVITSGTSWASATNQWMRFYFDPTGWGGGPCGIIDTGVGPVVLNDETYAVTHLHMLDSKVLYMGTGDDSLLQFTGTALTWTFAALGAADADGAPWSVTTQAGGTGGTGNHTGGAITLATGAGAGSGAAGTITLDSAAGIVLDMTSVSSFAWGGTALLKLDDSAVTAYTAASDTSATSVFFRAQSGGAHVAGNPNGADINFYPGAKGSGGAGTDGVLKVWHGTGAGNDYLGAGHDATNAFLNAQSGALAFQFAGTNRYSLTTSTFKGGAPQVYYLGDGATEWRALLLGEDTTTSSVSDSGVYLGQAQESRLRYNKNATGYPASTLILGLSATGVAAADRLALKATTLVAQGFAAASNTPGNDLFLATQTAGTHVDANPRGGNLNIELGTGTGTGVQGTLGINGPVSITPATAAIGVTVTQANAHHCFHADQNNATAGVYAYSGLGKFVAKFQQDASSGWGLWVNRDLNEAGSSPLASFINDHTANTQPTVKIQEDSSTATCPGLYLLRTGIAATSTDGLLLTNDTAATTGVTVQMSPRVRWHGEAMRTGAGEARQTHDWIAEVLPVTAAGADTYSTLVIKSSFVGGAFAERMSISTSGVLYVPASINTPTIRSSAGTLVLQSTSLGTADSAIEMATGTASNTTGEFVAVEIKPTINQASGTGNWVGLLLNVTTTAVGSGGGLFLECKDDSNVVFSIGSDGVITYGQPGGTPGTDDITTWHSGASGYLNSNSGGLTLRTENTDRYTVASAAITSANAAGPAFRNVAATTTAPTLCPNKAETDTGIGWASDTIHFIGGGVSMANITAKGITLPVSTDSAAVADEVSLGRYDIGAGNTVLAISQETAVAADGAIDSTHTLQVRINGATYKFLLSNV